jgi:cell division protein FtsN
MKPSRVAILALSLLVLSGAARAGDAVTVGAVAGTATVERLGTSLALKPGDILRERDVLTVASGSGVRLALTPDSVLDVGGDTQIAIERLAVTADVADPKIIVSLDRGMLRVDWHAPKSAGAPSFHLFFAGQRATLADGEYFFDKHDATTKICVATGESAMAPTQAIPARALKPSACYHVASDRMPQIEMRGPQYWAQLRERLNPMRLAGASNQPVAASAPSSVQARSAPVPAAAAESPIQGTALVPTALPDAVGISATKPGVEPAVAASPAGSGSSAPAPSQGSGQSHDASPASTAQGWIVNLASYEHEAEADSDVLRLQSAGYEARAVAAEVNGDTRYRVQLRGFASAAEARAKADEVQARFGYKNFFLLHE